MIASVSKVFVGGAAAKLFELGRATPDDEIPSSLRNPSFPDTPIKWRDLLTHRSSLARDVVGCCNTKKAPSYGRRDGLNEHNPTCPLDDLEGWYTKYLTGTGETSVGGTTEWWTDQFEECVDTDNGAKDSEGFGCANGYSGGFSHLCGSYDDDDFSSLVMCCACDPNASDYPLSKKWKNDKPGSEPAGEQYSNLAVGLLGLLIERAAPPKADGSAHSFASFSHEYIFAPLGMTRTAWFRDDLPADTHQVTMDVEVGQRQPVGRVPFHRLPVGPADVDGARHGDVGHGVARVRQGLPL